VAFPFGPHIRFQEFCERLRTEFNCTLLKDELFLDGAPVSVLERQSNGNVYRFFAPQAENDPLMPTEIRSICTALKVPPEEFDVR